LRSKIKHLDSKQKIKIKIKQNSYFCACSDSSVCGRCCALDVLLLGERVGVNTLPRKSEYASSSSEVAVLAASKRKIIY